MKKLTAWLGLAMVASVLLQGCSEATRDSMGRDVNRAAADVDQKAEDL